MSVRIAADDTTAPGHQQQFTTRSGAISQEYLRQGLTNEYSGTSRGGAIK